MRRLSLTLLVALAVVPAAALAGRAATGDGVLELRAFSGIAVISGRGVLWGQMDRGVVRVVDGNPTDGTLLVSGWERKWRPDPTDTSLVAYSGTDLHFRLTGGSKIKVRFKGSGLDLTAIGVGTADLTGDLNADDAGDYSLGGGTWTPVPLPELVVPFGVQPSLPATSP